MKNGDVETLPGGADNFSGSRPSNGELKPLETSEVYDIIKLGLQRPFRSNLSICGKYIW